MRMLAAAVLMVAVVGFTQGDDKKADPTGTWKWKVDFGGKEREQTLKLELKDGKLTGTMPGRKEGQDTKIEDGTFKDGKVEFKVTRERQGMKFVSKYSATIDGDTMKGTITSERDGKEDKREFEAKREKKDK
jgi:hypothetical protein